jgi:hypothetical protein
MDENIREKIKQEEDYREFKKLNESAKEATFIAAIAKEHRTTPDNIGICYQEFPVEDETEVDKRPRKKKIYYLKQVFGQDGKLKVEIDSNGKKVLVQPTIFQEWMK